MPLMGKLGRAITLRIAFRCFAISNTLLHEFGACTFRDMHDILSGYLSTSECEDEATRNRDVHQHDFGCCSMPRPLPQLLRCVACMAIFCCLQRAGKLVQSRQSQASLHRNQFISAR